jgi:hypothetical protein
METLIDKPWNYTLYKEQDKFLLIVLCGTVGMFEKEHYLTEDELKNYQEKGESYIDELAAGINFTSVR